MSSFNMFAGLLSNGSSAIDDASMLVDELHRLRSEVEQAREEFKRTKLIRTATIDTAISVYQEMREIQVLGGNRERRLSAEEGEHYRKEELRYCLEEQIGTSSDVHLVEGLIQALSTDEDLPDPSQIVDEESVRRLRAKK